MAKISGIDIPELTFQEGSAPSTPASTKWKAYFKTDGIYVMDDAGAETGPLVSAAGGGLTFTPITKVQVFNGLTTATTIARTLTAAITGVPADAVMVSGWITMHVDAAADAGNMFNLVHQNAAEDYAVVLRHHVPSGVVVDYPYLVKCQQSSGAKVYYEIIRSSGTITYYMNVTGYWAPA